jgi:uncharacterized protein YneF (UPF0154 family)
MMMAAAVGFIFVALRYRGKNYIMDNPALNE